MRHVSAAIRSPGRRAHGFHQLGKNQLGMNQLGKNQLGKNQLGKNQLGKNQLGKNQLGKNQLGKNQLGMSLIEIMLAVTILAILSGVATMNYREFLPGARVGRAAHDLKTVCDALATHDRDHPDAPYAEFGLEGLIGQYIDHIPEDPWSAPYLVDPFFGRVVTQGEDGRLQTPIPGFTDIPVQGGSSDDQTREYRSPGWVSYISGSGVLYRMLPDGTNRDQILSGLSPGVDTADPAPGASRYALVQGRELKMIEVTEAGSQVIPLLAGGSVINADAARFSPRGDAIVFVDDNDSEVGVVSLTSTTGVVTEPIYPLSAADGTDQGVGNLLDAFLSPDNRTVVFGADDSGSRPIYRVAASQGSPVTTVTADVTGAAADDSDTGFALSLDGKRIVYASTGGVFARSVQSGKRIKISDSASFGTPPTAFAIDSTSNRIAMVSGTSLYVTPLESDADVNSSGAFPFEVYDDGSGIFSLAWK